MMAAMVELFCDSFEAVPRRILLDIDDTEDRVHGGQQLSLWNAHYDSRCFLPMHIYEATTGKPVAVILRPGKTPDGAEVAMSARRVIAASAARWPESMIVVAADAIMVAPRRWRGASASASATSSVPAGGPLLLRQVARSPGAALGRLDSEGDKVRRWAISRYAARAGTSSASVRRPRRGRRGADSGSSSPIPACRNRSARTLLCQSQPRT